MTKVEKRQPGKTLFCRTDADFEKLVDQMMRKRGAGNPSDYIRGLILLDAYREDENLVRGHWTPGWAMGEIVDRGARGPSGKSE